MQGVIGGLLLSSCLLSSTVVAWIANDAAARHKGEVYGLLQGYYNNRAQAEVDALRGQETASKGGHEFVSVLIEPYMNGREIHFDGTSQDSSERLMLIARYFYGTDIANTFRCRLYEFSNEMEKAVAMKVPQKDVVHMKIYRPNDGAEKMLKANAYDLKRYLPSIENDCIHLSECNLYWEPSKRLQRIFRGRSYRGQLLNDKGVEIPSQRDPNLTLVVYDDLQITKKNLFINDRIYNKETGELVIGNTKNIPYKLNRVSNRF